MKRFIIISAILLLIGGTAFGYSLVRFMNDNKPAVEPTDTPVATQDSPATTATETPQLQQADVDTMSEGGLFSDNYAAAKNYVSKLSKEEMVGQMLLGICSDTSTAADDINKYHLSGMKFESENFGYMTQEEIFSTIGKISTGSDIAPIMAAQEEGGEVSTFSSILGSSEDNDYDEDEDYDDDEDEDEDEDDDEVGTRASRSESTDTYFDSPRNIYESDGISTVQATEDKKTAFLKKLGINLNLAPVVDMPDSYDQIMYTRALSDDPKVVSTYAEYCAKFNQAKGVSVALKHFPGYGTIPDEAAYEGVVTDTREADTIRQNDYTPFKAGAAAGAHFVMMSNVVVEKIDPAHTAALSPALHRELRESVGFKGLIITDVIDDDDYSAYADGHDPAVAAVLAGNDIILVRDYQKAYNAILAAIEDGTIDQQIVEDCCTRVIAYKYTAGILK